VTLKIDKIVRKRRTTVMLIDRVQAGDLPEVGGQLQASGEAVLQLEKATLVDVDIVRLLNRCEKEACCPR
jgi:hypothetical protein